MAPKMIGSINCYIQSQARIGRKHFTFNGTTLGLVQSSLANGATNGTVVHANFGAGMRKYTIVECPWDKRADGYWVQP